MLTLCIYIYIYIYVCVCVYIYMCVCPTGHIPMRQLVYRVHALPQSMLPLVWDFGQLNTEIEELYIKQMVQRYVC